MFILAATAIFIATGVSYAARDEGDAFASDPGPSTISHPAQASTTSADGDCGAAWTMLWEPFDGDASTDAQDRSALCEATSSLDNDTTP